MCLGLSTVLATFVSMATRARNGSARPRGGPDEAVPTALSRPSARSATVKSPARQAPRRRQGQGSQTRSGPREKKKNSRKPPARSGTAKGRAAKGRPSAPPRAPVVILVVWTGHMIAAAWMLVAGALAFAARAIGRGARDLEPHHRRDGVGLLTLGVAIVLGASLWGRMGNAAGRGIRTVAIGGFGSLAWIIPLLAGAPARPL